MVEMAMMEKMEATVKMADMEDQAQQVHKVIYIKI
jgi:hypothetical protein